MFKNLILFAFVLSSVHIIHGFSSGATDEACDMMYPIHGPFVPQESDPPVVVIARGDAVSGGQTIQVVIESISPAFPFGGFFIQARDLNGQTIRGNFEPGVPGVSLVTCGNIVASAATHINPLQRTSQYVTWRAPTNFSGPVRFHASVVQSFDTFWVHVLSANVQVV